MDLSAFMARVGARDEDVARAIGRDRSTINRIRRGVVRPDGTTLLRLNRWAEGEARAKRLGRNERLSWSHLFDAAGSPAA